MNTNIYKGRKKQNSYLYIVDKDDFSKVPGGLLTALGELEFVMNLELSAQKKLAQADIQQVINALKQDGFYLQMQNESEKLALADKKPVSNPIPTLHSS